MTQMDHKKRYGLFALAVAMLLTGGMALGFGINNFMIRSIGVLMCIVSVYLVRVSNVHGLKELLGNSKNDQDLYLGPPKRLGRLALGLGLASAIMLGISFIFLYKDALNGYNGVWPVYLFAASGVICALVWGYLASKLMQRDK